MSEFWSPSECGDCRTEDYEFIDGDVPCKSASCRYACKHLSGKVQQIRGVSGKNPWHVLHAGGLSRAIEVATQIMAMSPCDASKLPTADAFLFWSGEVPYSENLFWSLVSSIIGARRNEAMGTMVRALQNG